jgi:hypothetical protein
MERTDGSLRYVAIFIAAAPVSLWIHMGVTCLASSLLGSAPAIDLLRDMLRNGPSWQRYSAADTHAV